jgi:HAD superfamily hydrolase (TIGR01484 family)
MSLVPKAIVFDLDGTLAESKQRVEADMGLLLGELLKKIPVAIMSGGSRAQFETQFFPALPIECNLKNLYIFPTNAAACFVYRDGWKPQYDYSYSDTQRGEVHEAIQAAMAEMSMPQPEKVYGVVVQDRGAQITYSAVGQEAPVAAKQAWADAHNEERKKLRDLIATKLPNFSVSTGGITSIDITPKGINKAYGVQRFTELTNIPLKEMLYVGDALEEGGNDSVVIGTGVNTHEVFGPEETAALIRDTIEKLSGKKLQG